MRVTIILDSGGFLIDDSAGPAPLDVGYFETPGPHDIVVSEDGKPAQPLSNTKLGKRNETIDVQHLAADGSVKAGVNQSQSFKKDILKKNELYPTGTPDFIVSEYDCILRFHSGDFESKDVRPRTFKEHRLSDDGATGNSLPTRPIANDVLVHFDLDLGEELRLRRDGGTDVWSSSSIGSATKRVEVKLLTDTSLDTKYFRTALKHKGPHYHRPNPDPPPMNGNDPGVGGGG
ncbi:MAG: hypothetical protein AABN33_23660 [Acidobacteriota bacterium]